MSSARILRALHFVSALVVAVVVCSVPYAESRPRDQDWVATVVSKISAADRKATEGTEAGGSVTIRVRIGVDGSLDGVSVEESSGKAELDERALRAVRAASPFQPPPARILSLEGYTELSFPLQLDSRPPR